MERYRAVKISNELDGYGIEDIGLDNILNEDYSKNYIFLSKREAEEKASHLNMGDKLFWLERTNAWSIISGLGNDAYNFYYRAMHDDGMDLYDADDYAWLNTLIGYDIGVDHAKGICNWLYENDETVTSYCAENLGTLKNICELELGYHIDFSKAVTVTPEAIQYAW